jgi:DNA-binding response OmpR family regulator
MRILLAEDDGRLAEPLVDYLQLEQHGVLWLADGRQAIEALLGDNDDLALLDWMLPGLDGLSIVSELRRHGKTTLVMMLTARDDLGDVVRGLQSGATTTLSSRSAWQSSQPGFAHWSVGTAVPGS